MQTRTIPLRSCESTSLSTRKSRKQHALAVSDLSAACPTQKVEVSTDPPESAELSSLRHSLLAPTEIDRARCGDGKSAHDSVHLL